MHPFNDSKYTNWYLAIVSRGKLERNLDLKEKHHILPRSMSGTNEQENITTLTPREHFICHLLLTKMVSGLNRSKMLTAFWLMSSQSKHRHLYRTNAMSYEMARRFVIEANSIRHSDPKFAAMHSNNTKLGMRRPESYSKIKKPKTENHKKTLSEAAINRRKGMIWISNVLQQVSTKIYPEALRERLNEGWIVGRTHLVVHNPGFASHVRWHERRNIIEPNCSYCKVHKPLSISGTMAAVCL